MKLLSFLALSDNRLCLLTTLQELHQNSGKLKEISENDCKAFNGIDIIFHYVIKEIISATQY